MKKIFLCVFAVLAFSNVRAQDLNLSLSAAMPLGNAKDFNRFGFGFDANILFDLSQQFDLGLTSGYHYYFGKESTVMRDTYYSAYLPVAVAFRYYMTQQLVLGLDGGYAFAMTPEEYINIKRNDSGIYYAPKFQYVLNDDIDFVLAYKVIRNDGMSFDSINLGVELSL